MEKILVAIDFSDGSAQELRYALKFAIQFDSHLLLLHILHDPAEAPGFYSSEKASKKVFRNMEETASRMMDEFAEKYLKEWKKYNAQIIPGLPAEEIVRIAEKEQVDMIVMGTRGHSGIKRLMIGSVTDRVIRACTCPVLAVQSEGGALE